MRRLLAAVALSALSMTAVQAADFPAKGDPAKAQHRTLKFRGANRTYLAQPVAGPGSFPLVIVLHGATISAERVWGQTSLPTLGAREKFIVVAPQGVDDRWDEDSGPGPQNDVEFLRALIREEVAKDHADPKAVFMIGMSNGGFMTIHFACVGGRELRAAGVVSATLAEEEAESCAPAKPLPWIEMHGDADDIIPFDGGDGLLSALRTYTFFADRDRCAPGVKVDKLPDVTKTDQSTAERRVRSGCADGATSSFYVLHGAGHSWPNSGPSRRRTPVNADVDAGIIAWEHFKATLK